MSLSEQVQAVQDDSLSVLNALIAGEHGVALVDYPAHLNAGDSLIYRGETRYLKKLGAEVSYVSAVHTHDDQLLDDHAPSGPILLHGGGNFGDRYPLHQDFREHVVSRHRHRTVVQLPQTMDFTNPVQLDRTRRLYASHPDLHLLIRDHDGHQRAGELFASNHVHYCPDLAFGAGVLPSGAHADHDVVILKRRDGESASTEIPDRLLAIAYVTDWIVSTPHTIRWWLNTHAEKRLHRSKTLRRIAYPAMRTAFDRRADVIVGGAVDVISRGRVVVTDRLHAAIFGALLGKPVVMVDNANRKLSAAYDSYLHAFPDVHLARDFVHATELVEAHGVDGATAAPPPAARPRRGAR